MVTVWLGWWWRESSGSRESGEGTPVPCGVGLFLPRAPSSVCRGSETSLLLPNSAAQPGRSGFSTEGPCPQKHPQSLQEIPLTSNWEGWAWTEERGL